MSEIKRKICMIGDFGVGKTSLTRRFVNNVFSDRYLTTVGVKIDTQTVSLSADKTVKLIIWDIAGEQTVTSINRSYMRGLSGYILVVDGTRLETIDVALHLQDKVVDIFGDLPFICLLNKSDLKDDWAVSEDKLTELKNKGWHVRLSSAKTGNEVDSAFEWLARATTDSTKYET